MLMPHSRTPPKPGTLVHLLSQRYTFFNTGANLGIQNAKAWSFLRSTDEATEAVRDFHCTFFTKSGLWATAEEHDRETEAIWRTMEQENRAVDRARFVKERLLLGISKIRRCRNHFDLLVSPVQAFRGYYLARHLHWFLIHRLKRRLRFVDVENPEDVLNEWTGSTIEELDADFVSELDSEFSKKISTLALDDLPDDERSALESEGETEEGDDAAAVRQRKSKQKARDHWKLLCCAHELVQTKAGIDCLTRAAIELEREEDRRLLLHFTEDGPGSCADLFIGKPLEELAVSDEDKNAVRERLLGVLSQVVISAIVLESRSQSLAALPQFQRAVLDCCYYGGRWTLAEKPPRWTPMQWEIERCKALRDLRFIQELYLRSRNGKSRSLMLDAKELDEGQRRFLKEHLTGSRNRWHSLEKMAADRGVSVEKVKEELLEIARLVIKL